MIERGYAIRTLGLNRDGTVYKDGYDGESYYQSPIDVHLIPTKKEAVRVLKHSRKGYDDGTVKFSLRKITRRIEVTEEDIEV